MTDRPTYAFTADVVIAVGDEILLIERKKFPFGYALPGGHVDPDERAREAAVREAREEVAVDIDPADLTQIPGEWDDPDRDPRRRTITYPYLLRLDAHPAVTAGDDAKTAHWIPAAMIFDGDVDLAFADHRNIIAAALAVLDK